MVAALMTLFYDAQCCSAVVQASASSDKCNESYFAPANNAFVPLDTSRASNAAGDQHENNQAGSRPIPSPSNHEEHSASKSVGVCTISPADAITIFVAKQQKTRTKRDRLASRLAHEYSITSKAVRDIWNLRTWSRKTRPYWTELDTAHFAGKRQSRSRSASTVPSTAVEVDFEQTPPQDNVPTSHAAAGYAVQSVQDEQEDLILSEHDDSQDAVDETRAPSTGFSTLADDLSIPASSLQAHAGEWLVDSAIIVQEFEEIFLSWHHSSARRDCMDI